jgi:hypothetical protein
MVMDGREEFQRNFLLGELFRERERVFITTWFMLLYSRLVVQWS